MSGIMQEGKLDYQLIPRALKLCETHTQAAGIKFTHVSVLVPPVWIHCFPTLVVVLWICNNLEKEDLVVRISLTWYNYHPTDLVHLKGKLCCRQCLASLVYQHQLAK